MQASRSTVPGRPAPRSRAPVVVLRPRLRKLVLTAHVATAVGWLGAVVVFLALAVVGLTSGDGQVVRAVYLLMPPLASTVVVPLAVTALATGILSSLGTAWGLVRHYWVLAKLAITAVATIVLLVHLPAFDALAEVARNPATPLESVRDATPAVHAGLALVALLAATTLSTYKPKGVTPLGSRERLRLGRVGRSRLVCQARRASTGFAPSVVPTEPAPVSGHTWVLPEAAPGAGAQRDADLTRIGGSGGWSRRMTSTRDV